MRLTATDGSFIELKVPGYQFPDGLELSSGRKVLPDWLNVDGRVRTQDNEWTFSFPCLYADEAVRLGDWLSSVTKSEATTDRLGFTEPNITIAVRERREAEVVLRFRFSQEACPPGQPDDVRLGDGYQVDASYEREELSRAAAEWLSEVAPFPSREGSGG